MITLAFRSTINIYDVAQLGRSLYFAAEPLPASADFAAGQGAGLWRKAVGAGGHPTPVSGSEARRFYGLTTFELADGTQQLCAIGVRTSDLYQSGTFPTVLSLWTPDPLVFFVSEDGENWTEHDLGSIEKGLGPYTQYDEGDGSEEGGLMFYPDNLQNAWMNDTGHWVSAPDAEGVPCLWRSLGRNLLKWDGETVTTTPLDLGTVKVGQRNVNDRASDLAIAHGRKYFARNRRGIVGDNGTLAMIEGSTIQRIAVKNGDGEFNYPTEGKALPVTLQNGTPRGLGKYRNQWPLFVSVPVEGWQRFGAVTLPYLPDDPLTIDCAQAPSITLFNPSLFYDLGADGGAPELFTIRSAAGRSYLVQPHDLQDTADATRGEIALLETLVAPSIEDFFIDSGLNPDPTGGAGPIVFGTNDGYIIIYDPYAGNIIVVGHIDGPVLKLAIACNQLFALSPTALWWSSDWNTPNPTLQVLTVASDGYTFTDFITTSDDRLFIVSNNGNDSRVQVWAICSHAGVIDGEPTLLVEHIFIGAIVEVIVELPNGSVIVVGSGGVVITYDETNDTTDTVVPALSGETITAGAAGCDDVLYLGTADGDIYKLEVGVWSLVSTLSPVAAITSIVVINCVLYITVAGDDGTYWTYNPATDTLTPHQGENDVNVIIPWGDNGLVTGGSGGAEYEVPIDGYFVSQVIDYDCAITQVQVAPVNSTEPLPSDCRIWVRAEPSASPINKSNAYVPALGGVWRSIARRDSELAARQCRVLVVPGAEPLGNIGVLVTSAGSDE